MLYRIPVLQRYFEKRKDKMIFLEKYGDIWKIVGYTYHKGGIDEVRYADKAFDIPDSKLMNSHGQYRTFVDVDSGDAIAVGQVDRDLAMKPEEQDLLLHKGLIKNTVKAFGMNQDYKMALIGAIAGLGGGVSIGLVLAQQGLV